MIGTYLAAFAAAFVFVGLRSTQQLNVVHKKYKWILPTSYMMAFVEVFLISQMAANGVGWIVFFIGTGGGLGSMAATWFHGRYLSK